MMTQHLTNSTARMLALCVASASVAAMTYVGLYQSRAVRRIWCPIFKGGCEIVADAAFARPFGISDGYLAAILYAAIVLLLLLSSGRHWAWIVLLILAGLAAVANFLGVRDMANLGSFCFYCMMTTALSPILLWLVWRLRSAGP